MVDLEMKTANAKNELGHFHVINIYPARPRLRREPASLPLSLGHWSV